MSILYSNLHSGGIRMSTLMLPLFQLEKYATQVAVEQILETNEKAIEYGLYLTQTDALELIETRNEVLQQIGRIEIGSATISKLINAFYDSSFINQQEYSETLSELLEIFYYMKNESLELISDDDLIDLMKNYFENRCMGSLELLKNRELEKVSRNIRFGVADFYDIDGDGDDNEAEEEGKDGYNNGYGSNFNKDDFYWGDF
jgi:hypothetical protein